MKIFYDEALYLHRLLTTDDRGNGDNDNGDNSDNVDDTFQRKRFTFQTMKFQCQ